MPKQILGDLELEELTAAEMASTVGGANGPGDCHLVQKIIAGVVTFVLVCGAGTGDPGGPHLPEPPHAPVPGAPPIVVTPSPKPPAPPAPSPGNLRLTNPT